jgi:hypothetical protein
MGHLRSLFPAFSFSLWLREQVLTYGLVRRRPSRFTPGETVSDALSVAVKLRDQSIGTMFIYRGENISDPTEVDGNYFRLALRLLSHMARRLAERPANLWLVFRNLFCIEQPV